MPIGRRLNYTKYDTYFSNVIDKNDIEGIPDEQVKENLIAAEIDLDQEAEKSTELNDIEVVAITIQEALSIASKELQVPINALKYKIIKKGRSGMFSIGQMPYHIYVTKKELTNITKKEVQTNQVDEADEENNVLVNVNGKSIVRIFKRGICLKVVKEQGMGIPSDLPSTIKKIHRIGVIDYDKTLVANTVKDKTGEFVIIAPYNRPSNTTDMKIHIGVSENKMEAIINIFPPKPGGLYLEVSQVILALKKYNIRYGISEDKIEKALDDQVYNANVIVARGQPSNFGKDAYIEYLVNTDKTSLFQEDDKGRVNFFEKTQ